MKKLLFITIWFLLTYGMSISLAKDFSDLNKDHWAYDCINELSLKNVINGFEDGTFRPNDSVTFAQFYKLICSADKGQDYFNSLGRSYTDWWEPYLEYAVENGCAIKNSYTFEEMNMPITRKDMAIIVGNFCMSHRFLGNVVDDGTTVFTDTQDFSKEDIAKLEYARFMFIITGYEDGSFRPNNNLTRAEASVIIYRYTDILEYSKEAKK